MRRRCVQLFGKDRKMRHARMVIGAMAIVLSVVNIASADTFGTGAI